MNSETPHPYLDKLIRRPNVKERKEFVVYLKGQQPTTITDNEKEEEEEDDNKEKNVSGKREDTINKTVDMFTPEDTKKNGKNVSKISFFDDREETNINRDLILAKLVNKMGVVHEKEQQDNLEKEKEPETSTLFLDEVDTNITPATKDIFPSTSIVEEITEEKMENTKPRRETGVANTSGILRRPKKDGEKRKVEKQINVLAKAKINKSVNINGTSLFDRLPKPEKIVMRVSNYYMENRKMYAQKLAEMFVDYNKELLKEESNISCDSATRTDKEQLMIHQRVARDYLNLFTPYRGLLLQYGLGAGKTLASIAIAEGMKSEKKIILMTPASLKSNYMTELKKYGEQLYRKNQYWEFISTEGKPEYVDILATVLSLPVDFINKHKGAFLVNVNKKEVNFQDLDAKKQELLDLQLEQMIRAKYTDINYNGLTKRIFNEFTQNNTINPFDNSVVIIDEAHNFVSWIVNKLKEPTHDASKMYDLLMGAENARVVLLTGTPIINYPNEIAVLFNILRGYIKTWEFHITSKGFSKEKLLNMFDKENLMVYDYIDYTNDKLTITRNPFGFINTKKEINEKKEVDVGSSHTTITELEQELPEVKVVDKSHIDSDELDLLETNEEEEKEQNQEEKAEKFQSIRENEDVQPTTTLKRKTIKKTPSKTVSKVLRRTIKNKSIEEQEENKDDDKMDGGKKSAKKGNDVKKEKFDAEKDIFKVVNGMLIDNDKAMDTLKVEMNENMQRELDKEMLQHVNNMGESALEMKGGEVFVDTDYKGVFFKDEQGNISDQLFLAKVKEILTKHEITFAPKVKVNKYKCLPDNPEDFNALFVDTDSQVVKNINLFKKRVLGLSSYFRSAQEGLLPTIITDTDGSNYHLEFVEMSDHQFKEYSRFRSAEIKEQDKKMLQQKKKGKEDDNFTASYRIYSRSACNFTFPDAISRPMPDTVRNENEVDETTANKMASLDIERPENEIVEKEDEVETDGAEKNTYKIKIKNALDKLKAGVNIEPHPLSDEGLAVYSPKFLRMIENITDEENNGLHLLYSDFISLEGVGILKLILEHNGYSELKIKKVDNDWDIDGWDDEEERAKPKFILYTGETGATEKEILRNVYNSDWRFVPTKIVNKLESVSKNNHLGQIARVLIITSAGAEGINLKNTRFVHITEPYWNMVRIDQVVGRARRICSHNDLPKELQTVKVFFYLSTFSKKQIDGKENKDVMIRDTDKKGHPITTDEHLYMRSIEKQTLNMQLLKAVKETAIDCNLYAKTRDAEGLVCFGYGKVSTNSFASYPRIDDDMKIRDELNVRETKLKLDKATIKINGVQREFAKDSEGKLYDFDVYQNSGQLVYVGKLERIDGKIRVVM